jgi:hypothetical protein
MSIILGLQDILGAAPRSFELTKAVWGISWA